MTDNACLDGLIARHLDGRAGAVELAELDAALCASPEEARRFAAQARIDADLRTTHRATGEVVDVAGSITQRIAIAERQAARRSARRLRLRPRRTRWLLPFAAGLAASVGVLAWLANGADATATTAGPFAVAGRGVSAGAVLSGTIGITGGGSVVLAAGSRAVADPVDIDLTGQEPIERVWVSRKHAVIHCDGRRLVLEDLNSLNGTFVNRIRLTAGSQRGLQLGDVVQFGTVQMRVSDPPA